MGEFADRVEAWAKKSIANTTFARKKIALEVFSRVVMRSPVGNVRLWKVPRKGYVGGRFRANWQCTIGAPATGTVDSTDQNRAIRSISGALSKLAEDKDEQTNLTNNLAYSEVLEKGRSTQAPVGMVAVTVAEFGGIVEEAVR